MYEIRQCSLAGFQQHSMGPLHELLEEVAKAGDGGAVEHAVVTRPADVRDATRHHFVVGAVARHLLYATDGADHHLRNHYERRRVGAADAACTHTEG